MQITVGEIFSNLYSLCGLYPEDLTFDEILDRGYSDGLLSQEEYDSLRNMDV